MPRPGSLHKHLESDEAIDLAYSNINRIASENSSPRNKLFKIRREIAAVNLQNS